ncbi:hypothetical protein Q8W42_07380 [Vibrio splendidus]|uniref:Uncharacterized protein n=2 Tax=Vibrio splendidus TaxID=29497 RepID=A0AB35MUX8_VIBSP|nr:hypothetical protein [Vibrio splendidus]MDP2500524.1 hypothetical protein [Vibrio splendidus]
MSEMLLGTHGTSRTRADSIRKQGFTTSKCGRHGQGIYMWCADTDLADATQLAYHFVKTVQRQYLNDNDPSPKVLKCQINVNNGIYMDLESKDYYDMFKAHLRENIDILQDRRYGNPYQRASKVVDSFVKSIEEIVNSKITVVRTKTDVPRTYLTEHLNLPNRIPNELYWLDVKQASCYVVREFSCIPTTGIDNVA